MSLIEMRDISKAFGAIKALDGANLTVGHGEVVGLVGDNAAGKSTLMKILSGAYEKDNGVILVDGVEVDINTPNDAADLGIEMVYQDLVLADNLDVTANIFIGREMVRGPFLDIKGMKKKAREVMSRLGIEIGNVGQLVKTLSGGQRQSVAISRAMAFDARLVIMDEPTANLSPSAADRIMNIVFQLKSCGVSVIYISHRMDEVERVSDKVVVMEHGAMKDA